MQTRTRVIPASQTVTFYGRHGAQTFSLDYFERNSERVTLATLGQPYAAHQTPSGPSVEAFHGWEGAQS